MSSRVTKMNGKKSKSILRKKKREENIRINSSTSDWSMGLEGKRLHINMIDSCSFDSLVKSREDSESLSLMQKAADAFDGPTTDVKRFYRQLEELTLSLEEWSSTDISDDSMTYDDSESVDLSSSLPPGTSRQVRFASTDTEMNDTSVVVPVEPIDSTSDESDEILWSDGSDKAASDLIEIYTGKLKDSFLHVLDLIFEDATGIRVQTSYLGRTVHTGTSKFTSYNDGRYHFCLPDQKIAGGAEIFGTEDKRRGTSTTEKHKEKMQIQVAGEMLATVMHRNVFRYNADHEDEILQVCPNLRPFLPTETSRTVYYLVFTHLSLRIAKAVFDRSYIRQVSAGYLKKDSKLDIRWSHRLRLNDEDDLRKAARLVMCLMLNLKDEFQSGLHYWLPYQVEKEEGLFWVRH